MTALEFNRYFSEMEHQLFPFALRMTKNVEDARDLLQETAMRAWFHKDKFEVGTNFKAWATTIMRNTFINMYRKKRNRATSSEPSDSHVFVNERHATDNEAHSRIMMDELARIVESIGSTYSVPFMMFYQGYKYEEISEALGIPMGTVKSRIFTAREKLRQAIQERFPDYQM